MLCFDKENITGNISRFRLLAEESENADIKGVLYNPDYNFAIDFNGIRQLTERLEALFNFVNFPQATHQVRSFCTGGDTNDLLQAEWIREIEPGAPDVKAANFLLHVEFRRNATWQGTLELIEQQETKRFCSELELIRLIARTLRKK